MKTSGTALPLSVDLTGVGLQPQLSATPAALSFGNVALGSSASLSFTLANTSPSSVSGLSVALTGTDFQIVSECGVTTLAVGSSCSVTIHFQPTAAGERAGMVSVASSDATSPLLLPLSGTGTDGGSFQLTVNGNTSASAIARTGTPATFALAITPLRGFAGTVALTCTPTTSASYVFCSFLPSTVEVSGGPQASLVTITTISAFANARQPARGRSSTLPLALCLALPGGLFLILRNRYRVALLLLLATAVTMSNGCGGGDSSIRYAAPGTYHFTLRASATTGVPIAQSVSVDVTVLQR